MIQAAKALVLAQNLDVGDEPDNVVSEFRDRFYDTELFFDRYAKGKFAQYLFRRHENQDETNSDSAKRLVEEANLFIEAAHACEARIAEVATPRLQL